MPFLTLKKIKYYLRKFIWVFFITLLLCISGIFQRFGSLNWNESRQNDIKNMSLVKEATMMIYINKNKSGIFPNNETLHRNLSKNGKSLHELYYSPKGMLDSKGIAWQIVLKDQLDENKFFVGRVYRRSTQIECRIIKNDQVIKNHITKEKSIL